jgi:hypothetical protein
MSDPEEVQLEDQISAKEQTLGELGLEGAMAQQDSPEVIPDLPLATLNDLGTFMKNEWLPEDMDEVNQDAEITRAANNLIDVTNRHPDRPPIIKAKMPGEQPKKIPRISNNQGRDRKKTISNKQFEELFGIDTGELAMRTNTDLWAEPNIKTLVDMYDEFAAQYSGPAEEQSPAE